MRRRIAVIFALFGLLALLPAGAFAQSPEVRAEREDYVLFRADGPVNLAAGDRARGVIVVNGDARIDGTVEDVVTVINGDAWISGQVNGSVIAIQGTVHLTEGASVAQDVVLVSATLEQAEGAVVNGTIEHVRGFSISRGALFFFWLSFTVVAVVAAAVFAALGGRQLGEAAGLLGRRPGESILTALIVWFTLPFVAVLAFLTVVGIPLSLMLFVVVMPALGFIGYLVAGTSLGSAILRALNGPAEGTHPYLGAILGVALLQVIGLVPFIGGLVQLVAGAVGIGALGYRMWSARKGTRGDVSQFAAPLTA